MKNKTKCEEDNTLTIKNVHTGRQDHPNQLEMFDGNEGFTMVYANEDRLTDGLFRHLANSMFGLNLKPGEQTPWAKYAETNPAPKRSDRD